MMIVVLVLALPIGVAASIYLEEFAPKNRWTDLIEVNISNLAAVPSIVFGILGLAIFINFAGLRASAPIVGGLVLTLMTLPTIIISTRAALKSVPPSIRDAALGVGASKMQSVFHHVLPLAAPGILTGTIIGLAQALGETAPLLLIGMVAFVREYPAAYSEANGLFGEPSTALPVQVYNWTQRADPAFFERASGAIIVLLVFLLFMNAVAIYLRRRFERRW
jgi:phosphate transport system permease protein